MVNYQNQQDIDIRDLWIGTTYDYVALPKSRKASDKTINLDYEELKQFKTLFQEK